MSNILREKIARLTDDYFAASDRAHHYDYELADRILAIPEIEEPRELGKALLSHLDPLMPAIEKAIAAEWKRGNPVNGPQFGATIEAFRACVSRSASPPAG